MALLTPHPPTLSKPPMPQMIDRTSWTTIKHFLERQAMDAGRTQLDELWSAS